MTRGGAEVDDLDIEEADDAYNLICHFGCASSAEVPAKSNLIVNYFKEIEKWAGSHDGGFMLPDALMYWHNDDKKHETVPKVDQQLYLDWQPVAGAQPRDFNIGQYQLDAETIERDRTERKQAAVQVLMALFKSADQMPDPGDDVIGIHKAKVMPRDLKSKKISQFQIDNAMNWDIRYSNFQHLNDGGKVGTKIKPSAQAAAKEGQTENEELKKQMDEITKNQEDFYKMQQNN